MNEKPDKKIISYSKKNAILDSLIEENKLLKAQLQAQVDRSDFIEDCIAEMAGVVYNTEDTTE